MVVGCGRVLPASFGPIADCQLLAVQFAISRHLQTTRLMPPGLALCVSNQSATRLLETWPLVLKTGRKRKTLGRLPLKMRFPN